MELTAQEIARLVEGKLQGDPEIAIRGTASIRYGTPDIITFVENPKYIKPFLESNILAALTGEFFEAPGKTLIQVPDPLPTFIQVVKRFKPPLPPYAPGIHPLAWVAPTAIIGKGATILPFASVGEGSIVGDNCVIYSGVAIGRNCKIGNQCTLYPNSVLYDECELGNSVILQANAVIGADGFGYRMLDGRHVKVPQLGKVVLGNDVEIGACTAIDRGTFDSTRVGDGTKIDNLVQVGHNCDIGKHNLLVSQVGIAGSCTTGNYVVMAGQSGLAGHLQIGDKVVIGARSGLIRDALSGEHVLGAPARPEREEKRILLSMDKLPGLCKDMKKIKQKLQMAEED